MLTAKLTKIQAFNILLEAISEQPVNQLDTTVSIDISIAVDTLD